MNLQIFDETCKCLITSKMKCSSYFDKNYLLAQLFISVYVQVMCTELPKLSRICFYFQVLIPDEVVFSLILTYLNPCLIIISHREILAYRIKARVGKIQRYVNLFFFVYVDVYLISKLH